MSNWNPKEHSKSKLGLIGNVPVSPFAAVSAQLHPGNGNLHLRIMGDSYITGHLRGAIPPARLKATLAAISTCPEETSYSGSNSVYRKLEVVGDGTSGLQTLKAGEVEVCKLVIDPAWTIISSDESIADQVDQVDGEIDGGDGGDGGEDHDA